jgi:hypothetical protein
MGLRERRQLAGLTAFLGGFVLLVVVATNTSPAPVSATQVSAVTPTNTYASSTATTTPTPTVQPTTTRKTRPEDRPTATPTRDPVEEIDVPDVNAPHVNLPDGALTGGYCRRHWWC